MISETISETNKLSPPPLKPITFDFLIFCVSFRSRVSRFLVAWMEILRPLILCTRSELANESLTTSRSEQNSKVFFSLFNFTVTVRFFGYLRGLGENAKITHEYVFNFKCNNISVRKISWGCTRSSGSHILRKTPHGKIINHSHHLSQTVLLFFERGRPVSGKCPAYIPAFSRVYSARAFQSTTCALHMPASSSCSCEAVLRKLTCAMIDRLCLTTFASLDRSSQSARQSNDLVSLTTHDSADMRCGFDAARSR